MRKLRIRRKKPALDNFLDAGATAVVGSHPHVLQPWEKYTTQDGRETLIVYSLGNLLAFSGKPSEESRSRDLPRLKKENPGQSLGIRCSVYTDLSRWIRSIPVELT